MTPESYPLSWPVGWPRTKDWRRTESRFDRKIGFARVLDDLLYELQRFNAKDVLLSTDVPLRMDGLPYAKHARVNDPGAAVYFTRRDDPLVIACDSYLRTWENVRAIYKTVEAMRAIDRHGASQLLERAVSGFKQLGDGEVGPEEQAPPPEPWWEIFGLTDTIEPDMLKTTIARPDSQMRAPLLKMVQAVHQAMILEAHPDQGGDPGQFRRLTDALARARDDLGPR